MESILGLYQGVKPSRSRKLDPAQFAERIRKVAIDAHQALSNPFVTTTRMNQVTREIHELRMAARAASLSEIDCWLDRLQRQIHAGWTVDRTTTSA